MDFAPECPTAPRSWMQEHELPPPRCTPRSPSRRAAQVPPPVRSPGHRSSHRRRALPTPCQAPLPECRTSPPYRPTYRIRPFPAVYRRPASLEPHRRPLLHERDELSAPASLTATARAGLLLLLTSCPRPSLPWPNSAAPASSASRPM
uniref:Uncharacterized protein n=1 Tax=Triticum urartu TaxID=4572 RepID=A0A8R7JWN4_TRIUA